MSLSVCNFTLKWTNVWKRVSCLTKKSRVRLWAVCVGKSVHSYSLLWLPATVHWGHVCALQYNLNKHLSQLSSTTDCHSLFFVHFMFDLPASASGKHFGTSRFFFFFFSFSTDKCDHCLCPLAAVHYLSLLFELDIAGNCLDADSVCVCVCWCPGNDDGKSLTLYYI